jgi:hypothetical protein
MVGKDRLGEGQHKDEHSLLRLTRRRTTSEGEGGKINTLRYALYFGRSMKEHFRPPNLLYFTFVSQLQQASDLLKFGRNLRLYPCNLMLHASDSLAKHLPYPTGSGESVLSRSSGSSCCCRRSSVASRYAVTACTFEGPAESDGGTILRVDSGGGSRTMEAIASSMAPNSIGSSSSSGGGGVLFFAFALPFPMLLGRTRLGLNRLRTPTHLLALGRDAGAESDEGSTYSPVPSVYIPASSGRGGLDLDLNLAFALPFPMGSEWAEPILTRFVLDGTRNSARFRLRRTDVPGLLVTGEVGASEGLGALECAALRRFRIRWQLLRASSSRLLAAVRRSSSVLAASRAACRAVETARRCSRDSSTSSY